MVERTRIVPLALVLLVGLCVGWFAHRRAPPAGDRAAPMSNAAKQLWTCGMHPQVIQDHPGNCPICHMRLVPLASETKGTDDHAIKIAPGLVQTLGVQIESARKGPLVHHVRLWGAVRELEQLHRSVEARVSGWVAKLYAQYDGQAVQAGDPLYELTSPELSGAIEDLRAARTSASVPNTSATTRELYAATRRRLEFLGIDAAEIDRLEGLASTPASVTMRSPWSGHAVDPTIRAGSAIKAGERLFTIADRMRMWIEIAVPEREFAWIGTGTFVNVHASALGAEKVSGVVDFVHPHVDPVSRTGMARIEVDNESGRLHEGMSVECEIEQPLGTELVSVPREAVIETGLRQLCFVETSTGRFEPRELTLGPEADGGRIVVYLGLSAGERVVVSGQFLLDSESRLREAVRKFGAGPPPAPLDWTRAMDGLLVPYLALADALGKKAELDTPFDVEPLIAAATELARVLAGSPHASNANAIAALAPDLRGAGLETQRQPFRAFSESVVALAEALPPSRALGTELPVMHCPMAPGRWLQRTHVLANPFYGTTMKECGDEVGLIRPRGGESGSTPK